MTIKERPQTSDLRECGLPAPTWHREREELPAEDSVLDLLDGSQVVRRPRKSEHFGEVLLAEESEILASCCFAFWLRGWIWRTNVATLLPTFASFRVEVVRMLVRVFLPPVFAHSTPTRISNRK